MNYIARRTNDGSIRVLIKETGKQITTITHEQVLDFIAVDLMTTGRDADGLKEALVLNGYLKDEDTLGFV